jgi:hypothetical protein
MPSRPAFTVLLAVLLLARLAAAGDPLQDKALRAAVVPDADLLLSQDGAGWLKAPIQAKMDAIRAELTAKAAPGSQAKSVQVRMDKFVETLGIAKEDVAAMLFSARVRGLDRQQGNMTPQLALQQLGLVAALRVTKPLSLPKIRLALSNAAAEGGLELMFEKGEYKGATTLSVVRPDQPGKSTWLPREITVALLDSETAAYVGTDADVKAALDRWAAGTPAPLVAALQGALDSAAPGALTSLFFVPDDTMRTKAKESAAKMQGQNPLFAGAMQAVAGLQSVVFDARATDRVSMQLTGAFAAPQEALQMKTMIDGMVLGMGKMLLMQAVGRPIPFIESLTSRQTGTAVSLVADLTEEDCRALIELQSKGPQGAPGFPGAPPAAPAGVPAPQAAPAAPAN